MPYGTSEPSQITAGDSLAWSASFSDYLPGDGWTLSYGLTGASTQRIDATTGPDGLSFAVALPTTATAAWTPGCYLLTAFVNRGNGTERVTLYSRALEVLPNPTAAAPTTHAQRCLALIEAAMEGRIPRGLEETTIDGQMISRIPMKELFDLHEKYEAKVKDETALARAAAGVQRRNQIYVRFRRPGGRSHGQQMLTLLPSVGNLASATRTSRPGPR